jgi:hypothetical protein
MALATNRPATSGNLPQDRALTTSELSRVVDAAIAYWAATGTSKAQLRELNQVTFRVVDLPGAYLGIETPGTVFIDQNADGYGWFIDATPEDSSEFTRRGDGGELVATRSSPAWGRMDLLTLITHELGHALGLADNDGQGLMGEFLPLGTRRLPAAPVPSPSRDAAGVPSSRAAASGSTATALDHLVQGSRIVPAGGSGGSLFTRASAGFRIGPHRGGRGERPFANWKPKASLPR